MTEPSDNSSHPEDQTRKTSTFAQGGPNVVKNARTSSTHHTHRSRDRPPRRAHNTVTTTTAAATTSTPQISVYNVSDSWLVGAHRSAGTAFHARHVCAHDAALPRLRVEALGEGPLRRQGVCLCPSCRLGYAAGIPSSLRTRACLTICFVFMLHHRTLALATRCLIRSASRGGAGSPTCSRSGCGRSCCRYRETKWFVASLYRSIHMYIHRCM